MIRYSIIYVNFRSLSEIKDSLATLYGHHQDVVHTSPHEIEVIVVSNSPLLEEESFRQSENGHWVSEDERWEGVRFIQSDANLGFGKACNMGASYANGEFLLFLNPDTRLLNPVLPILASTWKESRKPGLIGPAIYNESGKRTPSIKNRLSVWFFLWWVFPFIRFVIPSSSSYLSDQPVDRTEVDILMGSVLFISRERFQEIGGFSDLYFMYWEENDLCMRLRHQGYSVIYEPLANVIHKGKYSTSPMVERMEIEKHRSQKVFIKRFYPQWITLNRLAGSVAYGWRTIAYTLTGQQDKRRINKILWRWYTCDYGIEMEGA